MLTLTCGTHTGSSFAHVFATHPEYARWAAALRAPRDAGLAAFRAYARARLELGFAPECARCGDIKARIFTRVEVPDGAATHYCLACDTIEL